MGGWLEDGFVKVDEGNNFLVAGIPWVPYRTGCCHC